jgi:hypothetical protein
MEEALYHQFLKALEEGRVEIKISIPNPTPPSAHFVHFSLLHILWRRLASKLLHQLDADIGEIGSRD